MKVGNMKFSESEILKATGGNLVYTNKIQDSFSLSTDSRTINTQDIYIPIKGENFNGHDFIEKAIQNGCSGFLIETSEKNRLKTLPKANFAIEVSDTKEAYLALGKYYKDKINPIVIGVTGSSGKTTTKEILAKVLEGLYKVHKTKLNHNNEIGTAQTMLEMPEDTEVLILEMGMRGLGEIELLSRYANPDIAIITNIGLAHVGILGSQEKIAQAKCEIIHHLKKEGVLIACKTPLLKEYTKNCNTICYSLDSENLKNIKKTPTFTTFEYKNHSYKINVQGDYNILNSLCAIETAIKLDVPPCIIEAQLEKYQPLDNRGQLVKINNLTFITDYYNANPESMKASILASIESHKELGLVLGDMGELGSKAEDYHKEIGEFLKGKDLKHLVTIGTLSKNISKYSEFDNAIHFDTIDNAIKYLKKIEEPCTLLLKASRTMEFEKIIHKLKGQTS